MFAHSNDAMRGSNFMVEASGCQPLPIKRIMIAGGMGSSGNLYSTRSLVLMMNYLMIPSPKPSPPICIEHMDNRIVTSPLKRLGGGKKKLGSRPKLLLHGDNKPLTCCISDCLTGPFQRHSVARLLTGTNKQSKLGQAKCRQRPYTEEQL
jgi:hypothetical protein